jgi:hypothetical protein
MYQPMLEVKITANGPYNWERQVFDRNNNVMSGSTRTRKEAKRNGELLFLKSLQLVGLRKSRLKYQQSE